MKIAISSKGPGLDALFEPRFGRSQFFVVFDASTGKTENISNENASAQSGAGIQTAQLMVNRGIQTVITGSVGPKAGQVLTQAGIEVHSTKSSSVREALAEYTGLGPREEPEAASSPHTEDAHKPGRDTKYKVAVATDGNMVASHFGHCPSYTIATVEKGQILEQNVIPNPGHKPGFLPRYLAELGIACIIVGGMGPSAQDLFRERQIQTIIGIQGLVDEVIASYITGQLEPGESLCDHK